MKQLNHVKDFGKSPSGDMSKLKSAANGTASPDKIGTSKTCTEPGKPASGEMSAVKHVADICPTGTKR